MASITASGLLLLIHGYLAVAFYVWVHRDNTSATNANRSLANIIVALSAIWTSIAIAANEFGYVVHPLLTVALLSLVFGYATLRQLPGKNVWMASLLAAWVSALTLAIGAQVFNLAVSICVSLAMQLFACFWARKRG